MVCSWVNVHNAHNVFERQEGVGFNAAPEHQGGSIIVLNFWLNFPLVDKYGSGNDFRMCERMVKFQTIFL